MADTLLIQNGQVITASGLARHDVLIRGERIAAVGPDVAAQAGDARRVDAAGLAIFPGLIDVHAHLREPGGEHKEDFASGTAAALAGGFTSVLAMPNTAPPIVDAVTFDDALARADAKAVCDVGIYVGGTADNAREAAALADRAAGLKLYVGSSTGSLLVDTFPAQIAHFEHFPPDRPIVVHAENESAVRYYAARGQRRPPICAALSVAYLIALAEGTGRWLHVAHVTTAAELALIRDAKARGAHITCEVTPHHLFLTAAAEDEIGALTKCNPPLRAQSDVDALWAGLADIDLIATDHAPHTLAEKQSQSPPSGMPGLETALPLLLTAVHQGRLTLPDILARLCTRPADLFGLRGKGRLEPGCDADLTLVDLDAEWVLGNDGLHTRCGWTPFAGRPVRGRVERVYLRGQEAYAGGEVLATPGAGRPLAH
jgi:dihydroorotase (multifunctional complex type)